MANTRIPTDSIDSKTGFSPITKTFHSLRPPIPLPPLSQPLSITQYALSLLKSSATPLETTTFLIDNSTGRSLTYAVFLRQINSLASALSQSLSKGQTAFILSPTSLQLPTVYFALLSLGVTISPANPISSNSEIAHQIQLSRPAIAFATSATAHRLPPNLPTILLDSPEFVSKLNRPGEAQIPNSTSPVNQTDPAAILYSSGTTGRVKGVVLTHRNMIASSAPNSPEPNQNTKPDPNPNPRPPMLLALPVFHVFGFSMVVGAVATGETVVLMERFDFEAMLRAVEKYKVTVIPVSPPLVVALAKSDLPKKYDLSSLRVLACGGAPLGKEAVESFVAKFPNVIIGQGYGLTETAGGVCGMKDEEESKRYASVGRLGPNVEAKIVDPLTGHPLPPNHKGELWIRGPTVMKGYVGDEKATAEILDSEGWLKTGDLCMFDSDGFLYVVDRLKELIKYKAYQVPPAELEQLLHSHPEIADAAVIPYPNEETGQIPMAYVVRKPGSNVTEAQIIDFVAKQVAPYKKVRRVAFINSIPKTAAGKILRRELVTHAMSSGSTNL
ncbi:hypothetical protein UlMin_007751 [Ulmus minor]